VAHVLLDLKDESPRIKSMHIPLIKENRIMLNRKPYIENHKHLAEGRLAARLELLKSKGMTAVQIKRDPTVRHFRAEMRTARNQLADVAKLESQIAQKAEVKAQKLAVPKADHPKSKRSGSDPEKKRAQREKKLAAAKAEAEE
jgi:hypothetical protein